MFFNTFYLINSHYSIREAVVLDLVIRLVDTLTPSVDILLL